MQHDLYAIAIYGQSMVQLRSMSSQQVGARGTYAGRACQGSRLMCVS